jgi:hypothetical protein
MVYGSTWVQITIDVLLPPVEQVNVPALEDEVGVGVFVTAKTTPLLDDNTNVRTMRME